ncbi:MAG: PLDc_N domain-containing protein [Eubacterium sp.]|nr:PLDc_N domain-containing protein [Eubacterium sp.]
MQLKKQDNNVNQGNQPGQPAMTYNGINPENPPQNPYNGQPEATYLNGQPLSQNVNGQPQIPNGNAQAQSPYRQEYTTPADFYRRQKVSFAGAMNSQQGQYGGPQPNPYGGPQQYNNVNTLPNVQYDNVVIKEKSGVPSWLIVLIVLAVIGVIGYFAFGKVFDVFKKAEYIPGRCEGNTYTNEFFGCKVDLGSDWRVIKSVYDAENVKKTLDSKVSVTEFSAQNDLTIEALGVTVAQTPYNIKAAGTDMDRLMEQMKEAYIEEMEASGYNITNIERETMTIAGKTCEGFKMTGKVAGVSMDLSMVQFYMFKDNYVCAFSAASTSEGKCKLVISNNVKTLVE